MTADSIEKQFTTKHPNLDYDGTVNLSIHAYFTEDSIIDKNTIIFDCDPIGTNYERTYLEVQINDWTIIAEIRDFLEKHFQDIKDTRRTLTVPVDDGSFILRPAGREGREEEAINEIKITAEGTRIDFGGFGTMTPYLHTYEEKQDNPQQDTHNAEKLLDFLDEVINAHPEGRLLHGVTNSEGISDPKRTHSQLEAVADEDHQMLRDYEKAISEFKDEEYDDSVRDIGRISKELIKRLCTHIYDEDDRPSSMGARLNKLNSTEDGVPSFIGKSVAPAWWIRNQAEHNSDYTATRAEAQCAFLCFQFGLEKYVEDHQEIDVEY